MVLYSYDSAILVFIPHKSSQNWKSFRALPNQDDPEDSFETEILKAMEYSKKNDKFKVMVQT